MQTTISTTNTFDITLGLNEVLNIAKELQQIVKTLDKSNTIVLLTGDLSSGKTTFIKQYVSLFSNDLVTSPTFSVVHEYSNNIFHYDLYQKQWSELLALGIFEFIVQDGVHFIEWSNQELENTLSSFDIAPIYMDIQYASLDKRRYSISYE